MSYHYHNSNSGIFYPHSDSVTQYLPVNAAVTTSSTSTTSVYDSVYSFNDLLIHLLQPIGLWTISCINFDRYYAICSPLHYNTLFTTKKVSLMSINAFTFFLFLSFLIHTYDQMEFI